MATMDTKEKFTFLHGLELVQVCVGQHQIILNFEKDASVTLECDYEVNGAVGDVLAVLSLLGKSATNVNGDSTGKVEISFTNGSVVVLIPRMDGMESYQMAAPGKFIVF